MPLFLLAAAACCGFLGLAVPAVGFALVGGVMAADAFLRGGDEQQ